MPYRIRHLTEYADFHRCVDFQQLIWGEKFDELVPAAILWVVSRTGGIVAGAFDDDDEISGFVFGVTGFVDGAPTHWSDMLAVHPRARGHGIGQALKRFQRNALLDRGITRVGWTFDPLEARNAHLSFARLGITAHQYIPDCYGASNSPLHAGLSTDRLVASWALSSDRVRSRMDNGAASPGLHDVADAPVINPGDRIDLSHSARRLLLRIPGDVQTLKRVDPDAARRWRADTRLAFTTYFERGYEAVELLRDGGAQSYYLLARKG
jgi:chorismate synthase